jgi:predicted nucleotidyltransferase
MLSRAGLVSLHEYAIDAISGKATLRVIKALLNYKGKVFTMRELGRTAGVSHPEASAVVKRLEKRGAVKLQPIGRALQVSLNEESYLVKSILEPLFAAERETISAIASSLRRFFKDDRIVSVAIFGSVAKGTETDTSDIDLLIITPDRELAIECVSRASVMTVSRFGFAVSPLIMDEGRLVREAEGELGKSILGSYILVGGIDPRDLVGREQNSR